MKRLIGLDSFILQSFMQVYPPSQEEMSCGVSALLFSFIGQETYLSNPGKSIGKTLRSYVLAVAKRPQECG